MVILYYLFNSVLCDCLLLLQSSGTLLVTQGLHKYLCISEISLRFQRGLSTGLEDLTCSYFVLLSTAVKFATPEQYKNCSVSTHYYFFLYHKTITINNKQVFSGDFLLIKILKIYFLNKKQRFPLNLIFFYFFLILTCHTDLDPMTDSIYVEYLLFPCLVVYLGVPVNLQR